MIRKSESERREVVGEPVNTEVQRFLPLIDSNFQPGVRDVVSLFSIENEATT
jgi:hypothetical protein